MSRYTVTLYTILVDFIYENNQKFDTIDDIIAMGTEYIVNEGRQYIFDFPYTLFDESYKEIIETMFLNHYLVYEIGSETYNLFKQRLMSEWIMKLVYYNQLYKSSLLEFNPLEDFDTSEKHLRTADKNSIGNSKGVNESTTSTNNKSVYSDTPQGLLSNKDYATNATLGDNSVTANATNSGDTTEKYTMNEDIEIQRKGNNMDKSSLLMRYRDSFLNIDMMFIYDLNDLFMQIYD